MYWWTLLTGILWVSLCSLIRRIFCGPKVKGWSWSLEIYLSILKYTFRTCDIRTLRTLQKWTVWYWPSTNVQAWAGEGLTGEIVPSGGDRVVLYFHSGAYCFGSAYIARSITTELAKTLNSTVFAINYRRAPEFPYPAALEDALKAYRFLVEKWHIERKKLILIGDSAGAGLTIAMTLKLMMDQPEAGTPCCAIIGLSPWLDLTCSSRSWIENRGFDIISGRSQENDGLENLADAYAKGSKRDPRVSPYFATEAMLKGFPPTLIQIGEYEVLYDENVKFISRLQKANPYQKIYTAEYSYHPKYTIEIYPAMFHGFHSIAPSLSATRDSFRNIRSWIGNQTLACDS